MMWADFYFRVDSIVSDNVSFSKLIYDLHYEVM